MFYGKQTWSERIGHQLTGKAVNTCFSERFDLGLHVLLTLLHSERPKLHGVLAVLSAIGLIKYIFLLDVNGVSYTLCNFFCMIMFQSTIAVTVSQFVSLVWKKLWILKGMYISFVAKISITHWKI